MKHYEVKSSKCTFNVEEFGSAMELVEVDSKREVTPQWKGRSIRKDEIEKDWYGVNSYEEALGLLKNGWTENLNKMTTLANKVATNGNSKRISFQNNVAGFAPVVPLAIMGVPNSMIDIRMKPIKSKVVKILYNITVSCGTDTDTILKNGMKVIEAVLNLEGSGYRCELYAMQNYYSSGSADCLLLKVKDANQPLDLKRIMFPLIHPAMFRVIGFDWEDKCPTAKYRSGRGCALNYEFGDKTKDIIREAFGDNFYYIDNVQLKSKDEGYIEKYLKGEEA